MTIVAIAFAGITSEELWSALKTEYCSLYSPWHLETSHLKGEGKRWLFP